MQTIPGHRLLLATAAVAVLATSCKTLAPPDEAGPKPIDQATFALIDQNADGKVSRHEMAAHKHREGLAELDLDSDKRISMEEWKAARPSAANDGTFAGLDRNRDGFVVEEEAVANIAELPAFREAFSKMDLDHDDKLTWEEYAAGDGASLDAAFLSDGPPVAPSGVESQ